MNPGTAWSDADREQLRAHGLALGEIERQLAIFRHPPPCMTLDRACTVGDGIRRLCTEEIRTALSAHRDAAENGRLMKLVPASGAATRMFRALARMRDTCPELTRAVVAARRGAERDEVLAFMDGFSRLALAEAVEKRLAMNGLDARRLAAQGRFEQIIGCLLDPSGLNYAGCPKGLLPFHREETGLRTPAGDHLVEAAQTVRDAGGLCRVHFTVSPRHRDAFIRHVAAIAPLIERTYDVKFSVAFSVQKPSTDTIAVGDDDSPFRDEQGRLLLRPGGHGAVIENLSELDADVVYLKNIDNVVPDRLKAETIRWKRILAGFLCQVQAEAFAHTRRVSDFAGDVGGMAGAERFVQEQLGLPWKQYLTGTGTEERRSLLKHLLDRPMRVCGMVRNSGEPGGGPFWVHDPSGKVSRQIVEATQVDPTDTAQQAILAAGTHFNPVDLVCTVRDHRGNHFNLSRFIDPRAVFITRKSHAGRPLKALERPGLWNGAMAEWTTIFVEVPLITFNPVKTVVDLLRPEHQPA